MTHLIMAQHGDIFYINKPMACYRKHAGGLWSSEQNPVRNLVKDHIVYTYFEEHISGEYTINIKQSLCNKARITLVKLFAAGELRKSLKFYKQFVLKIGCMYTIYDTASMIVMYIKHTITKAVGK